MFTERTGLHCTYLCPHLDLCVFVSYACVCCGCRTCSINNKQTCFSHNFSVKEKSVSGSFLTRTLWCCAPLINFFFSIVFFGQIPSIRFPSQEKKKERRRKISKENTVSTAVYCDKVRCGYTSRNSCMYIWSPDSILVVRTVNIKTASALAFGSSISDKTAEVRERERVDELLPHLSVHIHFNNSFYSISLYFLLQ